MTTYFLRVPAAEVVRLIRAERDAAGGAPELHVNAAKDYVIEEEYDRRAHGLDDDERGGRQYDLVTEQASLSVERDDWALSVVARRRLGPRIVEADRALVPAGLTLDEFEQDFLAPPNGPDERDGDGGVSVRLETASPQARRKFADWWTELTARHAQQSGSGGHETDSADDPPAGDYATSPWSGHIREAVALFPDAKALARAMDALADASFDRLKISVLGAEKAIGADLARLYHAIPETGTDGSALRDLRIEGEAETVAVPLPVRVGGLGDAMAIIGSGGALAAAVADAIAGGGAGSGDTADAGIGAVLAAAAGPHYADRARDRLARGGAALWLVLYNEAAEKRALAVLARTGAEDVHVHERPRKPVSDRWRGHGPGPQLDPFLHRDPG